MKCFSVSDFQMVHKTRTYKCIYVSVQLSHSVANSAIPWTEALHICLETDKKMWQNSKAGETWSKYGGVYSSVDVFFPIDLKTFLIKIWKK